MDSLVVGRASVTGSQALKRSEGQKGSPITRNERYVGVIAPTERLVPVLSAVPLLSS